MSPHSDTIILIPSQSVFAISPHCTVLTGEAINTNFIVFGLNLDMQMDINVDFERTWWRLFQKCGVRIKFDIYVLWIFII